MLKARYHENSFFSFRIHITNYFILDHSNHWSFWPIWCCLLFQWYIAAIDTWFPIWLSILPGIWKFERSDLIRINKAF